MGKEGPSVPWGRLLPHNGTQGKTPKILLDAKIMKFNEGRGKIQRIDASHAPFIGIFRIINGVQVTLNGDLLQFNEDIPLMDKDELVFNDQHFFTVTNTVEDGNVAFQDW